MPVRPWPLHAVQRGGVPCARRAIVGCTRLATHPEEHHRWHIPCASASSAVAASCRMATCPSPATCRPVGSPTARRRRQRPGPHSLAADAWPADLHHRRPCGARRRRRGTGADPLRPPMCRSRQRAAAWARGRIVPRTAAGWRVHSGTRGAQPRVPDRRAPHRPQPDLPADRAVPAPGHDRDRRRRAGWAAPIGAAGTPRLAATGHSSTSRDTTSPARPAGAARFGSRRVQVSAEDNTVLRLDFGDATFASVTGDVAIQQHRDATIDELYGTHGTIRLQGDDWAPRGIDRWLTATGIREHLDELAPE